MTPADVPAALKRLGWRIRDDRDLARAAADFQRGYALPGRPALLVDGKAGPKTRTELAQSLARLNAGQPTASRSFSYAEFGCGCRGRYPDCARIRVHRELLLGLEEYRDAAGGPVAVVSGYRCDRHNAAVGGASSSQHLYGAAVDLRYQLKVAAVERLRAFSGIGHKGGLVRHVDVRHVSGNNTTAGTPARPTKWKYGS